MAITLNNTSNCGQPNCDSVPVNIPGPQGPAGADGANGINGVDGQNAYSFTDNIHEHIVPAEGEVVNIFLESAATFTRGQVVILENVGHFYLNHVYDNGADGQTLNATYLDYANDLGVAGDLIPAGTKVVPTGFQGPAGEPGDIAASTHLTNTGDILTNADGDITKLSIGSSDNQSLFVDSNSGVGMSWKQPSFSDLSGQLSVATQLPTVELNKLGNNNGAAGDLLYWNGTQWTPIPKGPVGYMLRSGVNGPEWVESPGLLYLAKGYFVVNQATNPQTRSVQVNNSYNIGTVTAADNPVLASSWVDVTIPFEDELTTGAPMVSVTGLNLSTTFDEFRVISVTTTQIVVRWIWGSILDGPPTFSLIITE